MINKIFKKLCETENCKILNNNSIRKIDYISHYENVIELTTEISLLGGVKEIILYIAIPECAVNLPKIFIKDECYEDMKFLPHINRDLSICIYDEGMNHVFNESLLPEIIEEMVFKAKRILMQRDHPEAIIKEFEREFSAYWGITYSENDVVRATGLSIITDDSLPLKAYYFISPFNGFRYLIYQETEIFEQFKYYLDFRHAQYSNIEVFEIDYSEKAPPFHLSFSKSIKYIRKEDLKRFRKAVNGQQINSALIIFKTKKEEYFGWVHSRTLPSLSIMKGWRSRLSSWEILNSQTFSNSLVERLTFLNVNPERLEKRTSGFFTQDKTTLCIVGLGSVGSNLLNFLTKLPIKKYYLIDSDILKVENVFRHQAGFNKIGRTKVDIAREIIINKNPFCEVITHADSIINVLNDDSELLNKYDLTIVVIGVTMIEKYIVEHLIKTECKKPLIIIWVEGFLASGQMIYIHPDDLAKAKDVLMNFPYSVLSNNNEPKVYLKEGSCQTGYFPYSEASVTLFLSAIFPYLFNFVRKEKKSSSKIITWVGDKEFIREKGLELSDFGISNSSFDIIVNAL